MRKRLLAFACKKIYSGKEVVLKCSFFVANFKLSFDQDFFSYFFSFFAEFLIRILIYGNDTLKC